MGLGVQKVYWGIRPAGRKGRLWDWVHEPSDEMQIWQRSFVSNGNPGAETVFAELDLKELTAGDCHWPYSSQLGKSLSWKVLWATHILVSATKLNTNPIPNRQKCLSITLPPILAERIPDPKRRESLRPDFHSLMSYPKTDLCPTGLTVGMSIPLIGNPTATRKSVAWPMALIR